MLIFIQLNSAKGLLRKISAPAATIVRTISKDKIRLSIARVDSKRKDFSITLKGAWGIAPKLKGAIPKLNYVDVRYRYDVHPKTKFYKIRASKKITKMKFFHNYGFQHTLELSKTKNN